MFSRHTRPKVFLSTAIACIFSVALVLLLNCRPKLDVVENVNLTAEMGDVLEERYQSYGWPATAYTISACDTMPTFIGANEMTASFPEDPSYLKNRGEILNERMSVDKFNRFFPLLIKSPRIRSKIVSQEWDVKNTIIDSFVGLLLVAALMLFKSSGTRDAIFESPTEH